MQERNSGCAIWIGTNKDESVSSLVNIYDIDASDRVSNDEYLLYRCSSSGKLIGKQLLRSGRSYRVEAAKNKNDELFVLWYEDYRDRAQITKYNSRGEKLWEGVIHLPDGCAATGIQLDDDRGIYVIGEWPGQTGTPKPAVKSFIYKIMDRK